jgi:type II secretory ATPase GspE/PulE/Tfp pilus assembly ATPase PilB-like protein
MESIAPAANAYDAKLKTAEAYETHGLYNEALVLYKSIIADTPDLDEESHRQLENKIAKLSREIDDEEDQALPRDVSPEEVPHIKTGLSIGDSAPEVFDSATAFKELGLYKEALAEYLKLLEGDYNIDDFVSDMIDCIITIHPPAQVVSEVGKIIKAYNLDEKRSATINYVLGNELARRGHRDMAIKSFEAVEKIDPTYPKIRETMEAIQPDKRFDSRYDYLMRNSIVTTEQLQKALAVSKQMRKSVETILMEQFRVTKENIGKSLSAYYNCPFKTFDPGMEVPYELISNLKKPFLLQDIWVPLHWDIDHIEILMDDPRDLRKLDHAKALFNTSKFTFSVGIKEDIEAIINHFFAEKKSQKLAQKVTAGVQEFEDLPEIAFEDDVEEEEEVTDAYSESSGKIVRLVDQVIISAFRKNASDIHIEPSMAAKRTKIRFRIDGVCQDFLEVPNSFSNAIISRIKILSNLDIAERRMPQDGKIKFKRRGIPAFELRVATLPTANGQEDAVMRLLASAGAMKIEDLTLTDRNLAAIKKAIAKPYGIVLVVGPTGSGKTTTLHSALHHINTPERKIWTAEDPVEITQPGLRQVEVKNRIGLDFSRIMRAFLRADPDVIMVGEMRDFETASIGIEASLTGHLVFSTLHTNSAPETVTRLLDMGLNPLNFSDAFLAVLAQRLIRRLCKNCKKAYHPEEEEFNDIVTDYGPDDFKQTGIRYSDDLTLYAPVGCDQCSGSGYRGRMGIHELMEGSREIKRMIKKQASAEELFNQAKTEGMTTLMQDGIIKVFGGLTDMAEVRRVCIA